MELLVHVPIPRERWPLAFRAAVAMAIGAAVAWMVVRWTERFDDGPRVVEAGAPDGEVIAIAVLVAATACMAVVAMAAHRRWTRDAAILASMAAVGAALAIDSASRGHPLDGMRDGPVTLCGTVSSAPRVDDGGSDLLSKYAIRDAVQTFTLDISGIEVEGATRAVEGDILVRVAGLAPLPPRGSIVRVRGWFHPAEPFLNPGIRPRDSPGSVSVTSSNLVSHERSEFVPRTLASARAAANGALARSMPDWSTPESRALVSAMTTGIRLPGLSRPAAEFRAAGMSHVLAISGFNVAVLVAACAGAMRCCGAGVRVRAGFAVAVAAMFLAITEPETSVLRAGLGAGLAAVASVRGGSARGLGTLGAVAMVTMLVDVDSLAGAGFQLSYGVVVALLVISPRVQRRWDEATESWWRRIPWKSVARSEACSLVRSTAVETVVASLVAWTISTPIALWHAGSFGFMAAPLSIVTMPAAALTTIAGVGAMATADACPPIGRALGATACGCASALEWTASTAASAPGGVLWTGRPEFIWTMACVVACSVAWMANAAVFRSVAWLVVLLLVGGLWTGSIQPHTSPPRISEVMVDSIAIGNGACHLIRTHDATVLFDAGTSGDPNAGSRRVVPALAALGVRKIDCLVIGSRTLRECSAIPEVASAFSVERVVMDRRSFESFKGAHAGFPVDLMDHLRKCGIPVESVHDGWNCAHGSMEMTARLPPPDPAAKRDNGGVIVMVRHDSWKEGMASVAVCGDPRLATRAAVDPLVAPQRSAVRLVADADGRRRNWSWTVDGWR
jgi:competence protein ComEC